MPSRRLVVIIIIIDTFNYCYSYQNNNIAYCKIFNRINSSIIYQTSYDSLIEKFDLIPPYSSIS